MPAPAMLHTKSFPKQRVGGGGVHGQENQRKIGEQAQNFPIFCRHPSQLNPKRWYAQRSLHENLLTDTRRNICRGPSSDDSRGVSDSARTEQGRHLRGEPRPLPGLEAAFDTELVLVVAQQRQQRPDALHIKAQSIEQAIQLVDELGKGKQVVVHVSGSHGPQHALEPRFGWS